MHLQGNTIAALVTLTLSACVSVPPPAQQSNGDGGSGSGSDATEPGPDADPACADTDGDGYRPEGCDLRLPFDCAPDNPEIYPGAFNDCNEKVAQDCSGTQLTCAESMTPNRADYLPSMDILVSNANLNLLFERASNNTVGALRNLLSQRDYLHDTQSGVAERRIGSSLGDALHSVASEESSLTEFVIGRGLTQVRVTWSASETFSGKSTYTVYADGRIHLREELSPTGAEAMLTGSMRTRLALVASAFTDVIDSAAPGLVPIGTPPIDGPAEEVLLSKTNTSTQGMFCAFDKDAADSRGMISMGWRVPTIPTTGGARLKKRQIVEGDIGTYFLSFEFDWFNGLAVVPDTYVANLQFYLGLAPTTDESACQDGAAHFAGFFNPPTVVSGDNPTPGTTGDEDGDGYNEGSGHYQFGLGDSKTLQFSIDSLGDTPPSLALRIDNVENVKPVVYQDDELLIHGKHYFYDVVYLGPVDGEDAFHGWLFINKADVFGSDIRLEYP